MLLASGRHQQMRSFILGFGATSFSFLWPPLLLRKPPASAASALSEGGSAGYREGPGLKLYRSSAMNSSESPACGKRTRTGKEKKTQWLTPPCLQTSCFFRRGP